MVLSFLVNGNNLAGCLPGIARHWRSSACNTSNVIIPHARFTACVVDFIGFTTCFEITRVMGNSTRVTMFKRNIPEKLAKEQKKALDPMPCLVSPKAGLHAPRDVTLQQHALNISSHRSTRKYDLHGICIGKSNRNDGKFM